MGSQLPGCCQPMTDVEHEALEALERGPWFAGGLRFACTGCGACCTGPAGAVYLSERDLKRLCAALDVSREAFVARYTRSMDGQLALADKTGSEECVFLEGTACGVYAARPEQCRTYPFWLMNILTPEDWEATAAVCEGIDHAEAEVVSGEAVLEQCRADLENDTVRA